MAISALIKDTRVHVGDVVRVHQRVLEEENKERIQIYEGMVLGIKGREENKTFVVRKISSAGIGVEKIFPANSPWIAKIEVKKSGTVNRAKLNYIRKQSSKQVAKITQVKSA